MLVLEQNMFLNKGTVEVLSWLSHVFLLAFRNKTEYYGLVRVKFVRLIVLLKFRILVL